MKCVSWNVNGLRACVTKGFWEYFDKVDADFFCIQETKLQPEQWNTEKEGYYQYFYSADKKGYSGTAIFAKKEPLSVQYGLGIDLHDHEGRAITLEYEDFYLVNLYVPNSKEQLARLDYRMIWEDDLRNYVMNLDQKKPVLLCGDMNVAKEEIDLKNPNTNHFNAGFSDEERQKMRDLLASGFTDSFRYLYPETGNIYSWWSYRFHAREKNTGWRIDYWIISDRIKDKLKQSSIDTEILGSDHCPVIMEIDL